MKLKTLDEIIDTGEERDLISLMDEAWSAARDCRRSYDTKWRNLYGQYRFTPPGPDYPWQADLIMPLSFSIVESLIPALVAGTPKFRVDATSAEMVDTAKKLEDWYDWLTQESTTHFRSKTRAGVKSAAIYGVGIFKTFYRLDVAAAVRSVPAAIEMGVDPDGFVYSEPVTSAGKVQSSTPIVVANNPDFDNVSVFDFYPSPEATNIQGAEYVIHQSIVPTRVARDMVLNGEWDERILDEIERTYHDPTQEDAQYAKYRLANEIGDTWSTEMTHLTRPVLVQELWAEPGLRLTVLNKSIVANMSDYGRKNPYGHGRKPFVMFADTEDDQGFWGISTVEAVSGLQHEINSMRNQRADATNLAMAPMYAVRDSELDVRQLVARPGGIVSVQSQWPLADVIAEIPRPQIPQISWQETDFLSQKMNEVAGISDYQRGIDPATRDTATEVNAKTQGTASRGRVRQENFDSFAGDLAQQWLWIGAQFWQDDRSLPRKPTTTDDMPFFTMGPQDFHFGMKIHVKPASAQETDMERRQQALQRLEIFLGSEKAQEIMGVPGIAEMLRDYLEADGLVDVGRYLSGVGDAEQTDALRKQAEAAQLSAVPVQVNQAMAQSAQPPPGAAPGGAPAGPPAGAPPPAGGPLAGNGQPSPQDLAMLMASQQGGAPPTGGGY